jgi:hypothetical protein
MAEYSISQIGTFEECALQYRLIYVKAWAEGRWAGDVLEHIKGYVSTEKRYAVTLKEDS